MQFAMKILSDHATFDDSAVKNRFCWEWFQYKIDGVAIGDWARKVDTPGVSVCAFSAIKLLSSMVLVARRTIL